MWIYTKHNQRKLRFLAPGSRLLMNSSRPENCSQAQAVPRGYQTTSGVWVSLTPHVHIIETLPEMELEVEEVELDPEGDSQMGAYQTETLMRWSEYHSRQSRRQLARQHLDQHAIGVIGGYQLQAGASAKEFGQFLKTLEAAGRDTKTLWASLVRRFYDKVLVLGNLCSIGVVAGILGQLCYNGTKILEALKGQAFKLGIAAILRAFCCGIASFITKEKYGEALRIPTQDRN